MANQGYGSTKASGKQQSLLSAPPTSKRTVKTPTVVETSSASIAGDTYHLSKIIIYVFIIFGVLSLIATFIGAFTDIDPIAFFLLILGGTIVMAAAGAYGMFICSYIDTK